MSSTMMRSRLAARSMLKSKVTSKAACESAGGSTSPGGEQRLSLESASSASVGQVELESPKPTEAPSVKVVSTRRGRSAAKAPSPPPTGIPTATRCELARACNCARTIARLAHVFNVYDFSRACDGRGGKRKTATPASVLEEIVPVPAAAFVPAAPAPLSTFNASVGDEEVDKENARAPAGKAKTAKRKILETKPKAQLEVVAEDEPAQAKASKRPAFNLDSVCDVGVGERVC